MEVKRNFWDLKFWSKGVFLIYEKCGDFRGKSKINNKICRCKNNCERGSWEGEGQNLTCSNLVEVQFIQASLSQWHILRMRWQLEDFYTSSQYKWYQFNSDGQSLTPREINYFTMALLFPRDNFKFEPKKNSLSRNTLNCDFVIVSHLWASCYYALLLFVFIGTMSLSLTDRMYFANFHRITWNKYFTAMVGSSKWFGEEATGQALARPRIILLLYTHLSSSQPQNCVRLLERMCGVDRTDFIRDAFK